LFIAPESILIHVLTIAIEEPKVLANDFTTSISEVVKQMAAKEDEEKTTRKTQLLFLTLESLIFNIYSKLKTNETIKLQDSLYETHASISFSILSFEPSKQSSYQKNFISFINFLLGNKNFYDDLMKIIPKNMKPQNTQLIAMQV
jgi:hypothetical protein